MDDDLWMDMLELEDALKAIQDLMIIEETIKDSEEETADLEPIQQWT